MNGESLGLWQASLSAKLIAGVQVPIFLRYGVTHTTKAAAITMRSASIIPLFVGIAAVAVLAGCGRNKAAANRGTPPIVPVVVGEVVRKDMPITVRAIGRV